MQVAIHQRARRITLSSKYLAHTQPITLMRFIIQGKAVTTTRQRFLLAKAKQSQTQPLTSVQQAIAEWQRQLKYQVNNSLLSPSIIKQLICSSCHAPPTLFLHDCYLIKVEVNSDNDITDTYTLDPATGKLTGTGIGKQITVSTGGSGTYANGFPLTNSTASAATNGAYMVIKPGTHTLRIRYWVKDIVTGTEGTITKILSSKNFEQNKYYNITANLDVRDYDGTKYYMWDAQQQYWYGYEWTKNLGAGVSQPSLKGQPAGNYAQNNSDVSRWYHEGGGSGRFDATQSCNTLPNINEMTWYAAAGDPRWDADELWTTMGHLYKGGMWFKKKANISGFNANTAIDGTDWRINGKSNAWSVSNTLPDAADAGNYFYLPASGYYYSGQLDGVGDIGHYWSSSAYPSSNTNAYSLDFVSGVVAMGSSSRSHGLRVGAFE